MCYRVGPRLMSDLRDESFALLANVLSWGQASSVVDWGVRPRDGCLYVTQSRHRRGGCGCPPLVGDLYYCANYIQLILIRLVRSNFVLLKHIEIVN